jgi:hypothetical protein
MTSNLNDVSLEAVVITTASRGSKNSLEVAHHLETLCRKRLDHPAEVGFLVCIESNEFVGVRINHEWLGSVNKEEMQPVA